MTVILKDSWKAEMMERIENGTFGEYRTAIPVAATWLVLQLSARKIPFRVMNLGAGVKLITTKTDTCPKCKGTGRI